MKHKPNKKATSKQQTADNQQAPNDKILNVNFNEQKKRLYEVTPQQLHESMKAWLEYPKLKGVIIIYEYGEEDEANISIGHTPYNPFRLMGILTSMINQLDETSTQT